MAEPAARTACVSARLASRRGVHRRRTFSRFRCRPPAHSSSSKRPREAVAPLTSTSVRRHLGRHRVRCDVPTVTFQQSSERAQNRMLHRRGELSRAGVDGGGGTVQDNGDRLVGVSRRMVSVGTNLMYRAGSKSAAGFIGGGILRRRSPADSAVASSTVVSPSCSTPAIATSRGRWPRLAGSSGSRAMNRLAMVPFTLPLLAPAPASARWSTRRSATRTSSSPGRGSRLPDSDSRLPTPDSWV